jgi:hypothetical protein
MATSQILGLFTSPEQYQANQMAQFRQQAASEVQSNPFQQAAINMRQAGYQLGGGIAGALGGVDPQLQKITQRQQILGMIDPANPDSYARGIQAALQVGDQEAAFLLRNEMMKVKQVAQEEQLNQMKVQDYLTQRGQGIATQGRATLANELVGQLKNPDGTINKDVEARLLSFPEGRAAISEQAKILPALRQLGAAGTPEVNPFDLFVNDPNIPAPLKATARQYQSSFARGIYDTEQADKLVERLGTATQKATEFQQTQDRLKQNQEMLDSYRQQGLANSQASLVLQSQQAQLNADLKRQDAERKAEIAKNKPLPPNLAKSEEDDYDIATSATNLATDANAYINRIKSGDIKFGLKDKASIATRGAFGSEDPDVIARQDFDKFIERMTSENLRLNKGVQTDKDFERELRLLKSAESAASAAQIMQNLVKINVRKVQDAKASIERRRTNAGLGMPVVPIAIPQFGERPPLSNFETTNTNPMGTTGGRR